jgi:predicted small secreted protein
MGKALNAVQCSMRKVKAALVLVVVSALVSGCTENAGTGSQSQVYGVSAQDPYYMIQSTQY